MAQAKVRGGPDSWAKELGVAQKDQTFSVYAIDDIWAEIDFFGTDGYVAVKQIDVTFDIPSLEMAETAIVKAYGVYSYEMLLGDIAALRAKYPDRVAVSSIGLSVQGRDIPVIVVGGADATRHVLIHAGIHGRENLNCNLVMMQIEYMLSNPDLAYEGKTFAKWLDDVAFHIIPMVNPDGIAISQTKTGADDVLAICALNLVSSAELPSYLALWKTNARGVDLNLQFASGWEEKKTGSMPAGTDYKGKAPMTQPEAQALWAYSLRFDFDLTVSYHSSGNVIYVEFPLASAEANARSRSLGNAISGLTGYGVSGTPLDEGAGYKDWILTEHGVASVTIETGSVGSPLPLSEFPGIWNRNRNLWPVLCEWLSDNIL